MGYRPRMSWAHCIFFSIYFRCNHKGCEKQFNSSEVLHYHLYDSHGVGDFVCDICGAILKPPINNLQNHRENTHGQAKVKCDMCGKMFKTKQTMRRHVEILHLGLKKHECEICGEKLKDAERLKVHIQMKHTKEPFQCKHCNFTSMSNNAVKRHRSKVHPANVKPT